VTQKTHIFEANFRFSGEIFSLTYIHQLYIFTAGTYSVLAGPAFSAGSAWFGRVVRVTPIAEVLPIGSM
jgi:hypothetical protein